MELQFNKSVCRYLNKVSTQTQSLEQTQEIRLPDQMPDVGRVLGCWGQPILRGKEWLSGSVNVSGGVMAWVMYVPENGGEPECLDLWMPFQMKWNLPETQNDGTIGTTFELANMDCRSLSARKLMVRATVAANAEAWEPTQTELYDADNIGEDVYLLRNTYPMELPQEAGEKPFLIEEEINVPDGCKIVHYEVQPQVSEQKVMAGKLVFRGSCKVHGLYCCDGGSYKNWDMDIPFSQFADLDRDYGPNATAQVIPVVTGMELETNDQGNKVLKCGISCQYVIYDRVLVQSVEDAYSPLRNVQIHTEEMTLPARLDCCREDMSCRHNHKCDGGELVDVYPFWGLPRINYDGDLAQAQITPNYQILYQDETGELHSATVNAETTLTMASDDINRISMNMTQRDIYAQETVDGWEIVGNATMDISVFSKQVLPMVSSVTVGESVAPDPARPSLILCKPGASRLWDLAKKYGSTVEQIMKINQLTEEPAEDQLIMIPVI